MVASGVSQKAQSNAGTVQTEEQKMKKAVLFFLGGVSACLWHLAFVLPGSCGLLIIPTLGFVVRQLWAMPTLGSACAWGAVVGAVFYTLHCWWLFALLWTQSGAAGWQIVLLYLVPVFVYTAAWIICSMMIWAVAWLSQQKLVHVLGTALIIAGYFHAFDRVGGSILGAPLGYPLTNPALPIVHLLQPRCNKKKVELVLVPLYPQHRTVASLYHALHNAVHHAGRQATNVHSDAYRIFMTPERAVAEVLSDEVAAMECCTKLLTRSDLLCIGALSCTGTALHQAAYLYTQGGIQCVVSKQVLVPFYEYLPSIFCRNTFCRNLFLHEAEPFCAAPVVPQKPLQWGDLQVQALICADFFLSKKTTKSADLWTVLVNDSVLEPYAAELLKRVAQWRALQHGRTCFYVGWRNSLKI